jgi:hypothetical protein
VVVVVCGGSSYSISCYGNIIYERRLLGIYSKLMK